MRFGMDFGGTNLKAGVFDGDGRARVFRRTPMKALLESPSLLQELLDFAQDTIAGRGVVSGGMAIKGLVDREKGVVLEDIGAGSLLAGVPLRGEFSARLGVPFVLENDARAYAWGEWRFGAGRGARTMVCMTFGTGIGCAVVSYGVPYSGADQYGGLLGGHVSIDRNGLECPCGHRGCLELYCSATALRRRVLAAHPECGAAGPDVLENFFLGVRNGIGAYAAVFEEIVEDFAAGIVNVIHAYSPDVVVLGGGVLKSADVLLPAITALVHARAWTFPRGTVRILAASLDDQAAAVGVAFHQQFDTL